ncbi:probable U6 snRNA-associated Sm-like protein LSm4 [Episyrphus balteatus]|uniref:probable U6 snRNA-associated Sm-like protein LSm4 n=1 Tax=Episyrphus balteatus TaxID=286459 RepID=UPI002485C9D0|nr:probable U6 snRNA-associated Sm-like protein LSm4 [Episyrphus balteatus]
MLPLSLLKTAQSHPMLVELKNGETYNGHLVSCDSWMNINLRDVICTSKDGDRFWRMPECYIRGSTIKYLRIPDEVIDMVKEDSQVKSRNRAEMNKSRGGGGGGGANNQNQRGRTGNRNNFGNRNAQGGQNSGSRPASQGNRPLASGLKNNRKQ